MMRKPWRIVLPCALLATLCLAGCGDRETLLSEEKAGSFTFKHYEVTRWGGDSPSTYDEIRITYGLFHRTVYFPFFDDYKIKQIDSALRLSSAEPAWLLRSSGHYGLLRESTGTDVKSLWRPEKDQDWARMEKIDDRYWYIPDEEYISRESEGLTGAAPGATFKAGYIFDEKTLETRKLPLVIPFMTSFVVYQGEYNALMAFAPDGQAAVWLSRRWDDDTQQLKYALTIVNSPSTVQRIDLLPEWSLQHPYPANDGPGVEALSEQKWFAPLFRWEKERNGMWSIRPLSALDAPAPALRTSSSANGSPWSWHSGEHPLSFDCPSIKPASSAMLQSSRDLHAP